MSHATDIRICEITQEARTASMRSQPQWLGACRNGQQFQFYALAGLGSRRR